MGGSSLVEGGRCGVTGTVVLSFGWKAVYGQVNLPVLPYILLAP